MAVDPPNKPHGPSTKERWNTLLRSQSNNPHLKQAEHAQNYNEFEAAVRSATSEFSNETLKQIWDSELDPSLRHASIHSEGHDQPHREPHHASPHSSHPSFLHQMNEGLVPGVAAALRKPKFMEEDPEFWKLVHKEDKGWKKANKKPGWLASKEEKLTYEEKYTDFYYGKLDADSDTNEGKSLQQRARERLKQQYASDMKENGEKKSQKEIDRDRKKLATYEENENKTTQNVGLFRKKVVPIKFDADHEVGHVKQNIHTEAAARYALLKKRGLSGTQLDQSYEALMKRLQEKRWKEFANEHPEKAAHFAKEDYKTQTFKNKKRQHQEDEKREMFEAFKKAQQESSEKKRIQEKIATDKAMQQGWAKTNAQQAAADKAIQEKMAAEAQVKIAKEKEVLQGFAGKPPPPQPSPPPPAPSVQPSPATQQASQKRVTRLIAWFRRIRQQKQPPQPTTTAQQPKNNTLTQTASTANSLYNKYRALKNFSNFGRMFTQGGQAATTAQSAAVAQGATTAGAATASTAATAGAAGTGVAATGATGAAAAGGATAAAGSAAAAGAGAAAAGAAGAGGAATGGATVAAAGAAGVSGWVIVLIVVIVLLIIAFIIYMLFAILGGTSSQNTQNTIPGLTLRLSGPFQVANSENIQYRIDATYTGTAAITLSDPLPADTTFVSATGNYQLSFGAGGRNTVTWNLNDNTSTTTGTKTYTFDLVLHPDKDDILVKNKILANAVGGSGGTTLPPNPNAGDFEAIMRGQGRNTGVLGDENSFTAKIMANEPRIVRHEALIRKAYQAGIARNVNPLVLITIWGEESGYDTSGRYFAMGCGVYIGIPKDFDSQLSCSVKTWDNLMKEYETKAQNGVPVRIPSQLGKECLYEDAFLYAAERYGPVCAAYDSNDHFHNNFYKFYKQLLGQ